MSEYISFVHLSDIHFNKFSGDSLDLDDDLRNEILRDIRENAKEIIDKPEGILVCGDIAFSGKSKEYESASKFLQEICNILEIPETSVFCVPGNHDVDQEVTRGSQGFRDMQSAIEGAADLDVKLSAYFHDPMYNSSLFHHIHEYNKFAGKFECNINTEKSKWSVDFSLSDDSVLRIVGLNSVVISSHFDNDERLMVLGQYQIPQSDDGVAFISLCHHPPECWKDSDTMKNKLNERVCVQLYGHKHNQRVRTVKNSLVIGSGATHPLRSEKDWKPRYNWLSICVEGTGEGRSLKVRIYPRILNDNNDRFIPDANNCNGNDFIEYSQKLEKWESNKIQPTEETNPSNESLIGTAREEVPQKTTQNPKRTLVYRFMELSFIARTGILSELNLINEEDEGVEHVDLLDKILQEAQEKGILEKMWDRVNCAHSDGAYTENPFAKKL